MLYINAAKLKAFDCAFREITGTAIAVLDESGSILFISPKHGCPYIKALNTGNVQNRFKDLLALCDHSDSVALEHCRKTKSLYVFTCPHGLTKVFIPIMQNDILLGFLKISRFILEEDKFQFETQLKKLQKAFPDFEEIAKQEIESIPTIKSEKIEKIAQIMEMCLFYLWYSEVFVSQTDNISFLLEQYIKEHLADDLSTPALCSYLHISKTSLYKISKAKFGVSVSAYVDKLRFEKAKKLLTASEELPVNAIAQQVGFPDCNHFSKRFKQIVGVSPTEYRTNYLQKKAHK